MTTPGERFADVARAWADPELPDPPVGLILRAGLDLSGALYAVERSNGDRRVLIPQAHAARLYAAMSALSGDLAEAAVLYQTHSSESIPAALAADRLATMILYGTDR